MVLTSICSGVMNLVMSSSTPLRMTLLDTYFIFEKSLRMFYDLAIVGSCTKVSAKRRALIGSNNLPDIFSCFDFAAVD